MIAVIEEFGNRITQRLHELVDTGSSLFEVLQAHINCLIEFEPFYTKLIIERRLLPESVCNTYIMIQSTMSFHISIAAEKEMERSNIRKFPMHLIFNKQVKILQSSIGGRWIALIILVRDSPQIIDFGSVLKCGVSGGRHRIKSEIMRILYIEHSF